MKKLITLFFVFGYQIILVAQANSFVTTIINDVNLDSLCHVVKILSGDEPVTINGSEVTIYSRDAESQWNDLAAEYLHTKLEGYGLNVMEQVFSINGKNIYAIQPGITYPEKMFIISAHYDSRSSYGLAPGADDNASGCAAVIEAARILSKHPTEYSIGYAFFDNEEMGKLGSLYYAAYAKVNNHEIMGVINLDMIGYDYNRDYVANIHTTIKPECLYMADKMVENNSIYNLNLTFDTFHPGTDRSDHWSFIQHGYPAILLIEDLEGGDTNGKYHSSEDKIDQFALDYFHKMSKAAIGTLADLATNNTIANTEDDSPVTSDFVLYQNYPNPFNPETVINYQLAVESKVVLKVYNMLGKEIATLVNTIKPAGEYNVSFNASKLASGVYCYTLTAAGKRISKKMLVMK